MASFAYIDASVTINSVDLSDFVTSCTINYEAEELDDSAMGDTSRSRLGGLKNWSIDLELNQDFAASATDVTLFSIVGSVVAIDIRPATGSVSSTNPKFTGSALVQNYNPLSGSVGDLAKTSCQLLGSGTLTRATA